MMVPRTSRASSVFRKAGSAPPHTTGSHSPGVTNSGPAAIPARKPSRSERPMLPSGARSDIRKASRASRSTGPAWGIGSGMAAVLILGAGAGGRGVGDDYRGGAVLHGSEVWAHGARPVCRLCDADVLRASEVQHVIQRVGGDGDFGPLPPVRARTQPVADDALPSRDVGLDSLFAIAKT